MLTPNKELVFEKNNIRIEWANIGEGYSGDYDPSNPDDVNLLRFYVYEYDPRVANWIEVEDASYCTNTPADTDESILMDLLEVLWKEFNDAINNKAASVKKTGERMSWISPV